MLATTRAPSSTMGAAWLVVALTVLITTLQSWQCVQGQPSIWGDDTDERVVSDAAELRAACLDPTVESALLVDDIFLNASNWPETVNVSRTLTLQGIVMEPPINLDLGRLYATFWVDEGGNLTFQDMIVGGFASAANVDLAKAPSRRAERSGIWPGVVTDVGSTVQFTNVTALWYTPRTDATCAAFQRFLHQFMTETGQYGPTYISEDGITLYWPDVSFIMPIRDLYVEDPNSFVYGLSFQHWHDVTVKCFENPPGSAGAAISPASAQGEVASLSAPASSSSSSAGAIAGGIVGGVVGAAVLATLAFLVHWRRRRRRQAPPISEPLRGPTQSGDGSMNTPLTSKPLKFDQPIANSSDAVSTSASASFGRTGSSLERTNSELEKRSHDLQPKASIEFNWHIEPARIKICTHADGSDHELGRGGFGLVYLAVLDEMQPVALKVLKGGPEAAISPSELRQFEAEMALLRAARHRNIVTFFGGLARQSGERGAWSSYMVQEYLSGGDLFRALSHDRPPEPRNRLYAWHQRGRTVALDVASGLSYLHQNNVLHLDIKSGNILLAADGTAKIGDVGIARTLSKTHFTRSEVRGTFDWCSPEMLAGGQCGPACDIWSLGTVLWEIITGERPRRGRNRQIRPEEDGVPEEIAALVDRCLVFEAEERPRAHEVVQQILASSSQAA